MLLTNIMEFDEYTLLKDAYNGGGGFLDGSYIFRHKREDMDKWMRRRKLSYYPNFVAPVTDSLTNPIFRKAIVRDFKSANDEMLMAFRDDVDGKGTSLSAFMKKAARLSRIYGVVFIVEDNFAEAQMLNSQKDALEQRVFPYLYLLKPEQIEKYKCNKNGVLMSITYKVSTEFDENSTRLPNTGNFEEWTWTRETWSCKSHNGTAITGRHSIGRIPVIPLFSVEADNGEMLPVSPMLSIARINLTIFNLCSELREILGSQAFSIMRYPMTRDIQKAIKDEGITTGVNNMLPYPAEAGTGPDFIAPSSDPAILLQNEIKRLVDDIYRQANLTSVVAVQTKQSGVAKEWDFEQTNQTLADMAESCENAETAIFYLFSAWTNIPIHELKIKYERNFGIADIADDLDIAQRILDLGVSHAFIKEVLRKIAEKYLEDIDDDRYAAVLEEIESREQDAGQAQVFE